MTRKNAIKQLKMLKEHLKNDMYADDVNALNTAIEALEQEPKVGHWIRFKEFENGYYHIKCSECGQYWSIDGHAKTFKYCFNCGARMESEET